MIGSFAGFFPGLGTQLEAAIEAKTKDNSAKWVNLQNTLKHNLPIALAIGVVIFLVIKKVLKKGKR